MSNMNELKLLGKLYSYNVGMFIGNSIKVVDDFADKYSFKYPSQEMNIDYFRINKLIKLNVFDLKMQDLTDSCHPAFGIIINIVSSLIRERELVPEHTGPYCSIGENEIVQYTTIDDFIRLFETV